MLRVITLNLNGARAAAARGAFAWLAKSGADVICVQELRAQEDDLERIAVPRRYSAHYHCAIRRGYSGVGIYARQAPDRVQCGLGIDDIDAEGRYLQADFGNLSVVSVYLPSGSSSPERQQVKFRFLERFYPHLERLRACGREVLLCGDWNIAHREIDLKNWRANQKNPGFLPEERAWLTRVFDELGFVDVFRRLDPRPERYTWWSNRGQAWAKNVGWRIDYQVATPALAASARRASIYTRQRFSDHAPVTIDFEYAG
jgi:exodeoxyribonuclease-3